MGKPKIRKIGKLRNGNIKKFKKSKKRTIKNQKFKKSNKRKAKNEEIKKINNHINYSNCFLCRPIATKLTN